MEMKRKNQLTLLTCIFLLSTFGILRGEAKPSGAEDMIVENINIGVILDAGSWQGKIIQNCISMAISDFYTLHAHYRTRIRLHKRDSKGQPLRVLSAGDFSLLKETNLYMNFFSSVTRKGWKQTTNLAQSSNLVGCRSFTCFRMSNLDHSFRQKGKLHINPHRHASISILCAEQLELLMDTYWM